MKSSLRNNNAWGMNLTQSSLNYVCYENVIAVWAQSHQPTNKVEGGVAGLKGRNFIELSLGNDFDPILFLFFTQ